MYLQIWFVIIQLFFPKCQNCDCQNSLEVLKINPGFEPQTRNSGRKKVPFNRRNLEQDQALLLMDRWEKKEEMRTYAMFHFPWKSEPGMLSQTTFQLSIYEFGKQDGDIHDNNSRTCLVWILTTSGQTRGPSASFKHGRLRRNTNAEGSLLVFSAYFVVCKKYRRAKWK